MAFTTQIATIPGASTSVSDITIPGADVSLCVFVRFVKADDPKFTLWKDAAATIPHSTHDYSVPYGAMAAVYVWLTPNSDADAKFDSTPIDWGGSQPGTVTDELMTADQRGFALKVDNTSSHLGDLSHSFQLLVRDGQNNPYYFPPMPLEMVASSATPDSSKPFRLDPTIIEKGDPGGSF